MNRPKPQWLKDKEQAEAKAEQGQEQTDPITPLVDTLSDHPMAGMLSNSETPDAVLSPTYTDPKIFSQEPVTVDLTGFDKPTLLTVRGECDRLLGLMDSDEQGATNVAD
jgi:hypothetical protein